MFEGRGVIRYDHGYDAQIFYLGLEPAPIGEGGNDVESSKRGTSPNNRAACAWLHVSTSSIDAIS